MYMYLVFINTIYITLIYYMLYIHVCVQNYLIIIITNKLLSIIIKFSYLLHVEVKWLTVHFCTSKEMVALRNLNSADSRSE